MFSPSSNQHLRQSRTSISDLSEVSTGVPSPPSRLPRSVSWKCSSSWDSTFRLSNSCLDAERSRSWRSFGSLRTSPVHYRKELASLPNPTLVNAVIDLFYIGRVVSLRELEELIEIPSLVNLNSLEIDLPNTTSALVVESLEGNRGKKGNLFVSVNLCESFSRTQSVCDTDCRSGQVDLVWRDCDEVFASVHGSRAWVFGVSL